jgi:hypothetical protein
MVKVFMVLGLLQYVLLGEVFKDNRVNKEIQELKDLLKVESLKDRILDLALLLVVVMILLYLTVGAMVFLVDRL